MKVAYDPERTPERGVERDGGVENPCHATDDEQAERSDCEEHRGRESDRTAAEREDVRDDDDGERDGDQLGRDVERLEKALRDACNEHVMGTQREAQDACYGEARTDDHLRVKQMAADR